MAKVAPVDPETILADHGLLQAFDEATRRRIAAQAGPRRVEAGKVIFQRGDPGDSMIAVARGQVKISTYSQDGKELVLNIIRTGEVFGEIGLLDGEPRTADAAALVTCDLLVLKRETFLSHLEANPEVTRRLLGILCQRLRRTSAHLEDSLFLEAPARLARALSHLVGAFGIPARAGVCIDVKLSQQQLGAIVGITRESVNKHLGAWQKAGWIAIRNGYITVVDADALAALAGREPEV
ncbi:Crp/Fnr family transcriptional regulator [Caenispirillum salinarum]|uniref:Crp/Fnr family transcriptional regulator n=1 Tax=Caenispirillum salinarum TaxID=859058 RepID=UPI00384BB109